MVHDFIREIYDTVADSSLWPHVLDKFVATVGARGCIISEIEGVGDERRIVTPYICSHYNADSIQAYLRSYGQYEFSDQKRYEALSRATDEVNLIDDQQLSAGHEAEFDSRPSVRRMRAMGIVRRYGGLLDKDNTNRARFSVHFGKDQSGISSEMRKQLPILLPHIAKAIEIGRPVQRLRSEFDGLIAGMDRLRLGFCLLDEHGRIVVKNQEFGRQMEAYSMLREDPHGRLQLNEPAKNGRLNCMLTDALSHGQYGARPRKESIVVWEKSGDSALCIEIAPLNRSSEIGSSLFKGAIVYSRDSSLPVKCDIERLRQALHLTKTETTLVDLLAQGMGNKEIAERRERKLNTINAQVKSILSKAGCANRTEFVRYAICFGTDYLTEMDRQKPS